MSKLGNFVDAEIHPVSRSRHGGQRWKRPTSYSFCAGDAWSVLTVQELQRAVLHLPLAFVALKDQLVPAALQGFLPGKNLFVTRDGRWVGGYIPAVYRAYPFSLAGKERNEQVLCFNESSGLLAAVEGELFYDDQNQPSKALAEVLNFMQALTTSRQTTQKVCAMLQKHQLLQPWPVKVQGDNGEQVLDGLLRIDEAALAALDTTALAEVRDAQALLAAYCQLLSMQHLSTLFKLAKAHAEADTRLAPPPPTKSKELDLSFLEGRETFTFG